MEKCSALLALWARNSEVTDEFPSQRPVMFSLFCVWTNRGVNNPHAGDFRRHCANYDVTVMIGQLLITLYIYAGHANPNKHDLEWIGWVAVELWRAQCMARTNERADKRRQFYSLLHSTISLISLMRNTAVIIIILLHRMSLLNLSLYICDTIKSCINKS